MCFYEEHDVNCHRQQLLHCRTGPAIAIQHRNRKALCYCGRASAACLGGSLLRGKAGAAPAVGTAGNPAVGSAVVGWPLRCLLLLLLCWCLLCLLLGQADQVCAIPLGCDALLQPVQLIQACEVLCRLPAVLPADA